jgi:UDP:flavonoid glycosyltransferase YjiC (YdhE family)
MRVLVTATPVPTHFMPLVSLAWALRSAGHEILVAGQPDIMATVRSAGLGGASVGDWFRVGDLMRDHLREGERAIQAFGRPKPLTEFPDVWLRHSDNVLPGYLELARSFQPDLIVSDVLECNALILGGVLGIPVIHHRWGVDPISGPVRTAARTALQERCEHYGLDALPDPTVLLDPCPPRLQLPDAAPGTAIRYVPFNGGGLLPSWLPRKSSDGGIRRVAVSLGVRSLALNGVPHLRRILQSFDGLTDTEAVVTVEERYREEIGRVPANVRMIEPTPLHLFLGACSAVVHHGGSGTVMTSTSFGLPQLALPQLADQFAHGDRLAASGAGITLDDAESQDDPQRLSESLTDLLSDPGYRTSAGELGRYMERMPTPSRVVSDLERIA